jgi:hypothetical protein
MRLSKQYNATEGYVHICDLRSKLLIYFTTFLQMQIHYSCVWETWNEIFHFVYVADNAASMRKNTCSLFLILDRLYQWWYTTELGLGEKGLFQSLLTTDKIKIDPHQAWTLTAFVPKLLFVCSFGPRRQKSNRGDITDPFPITWVPKREYI